MSDLPNESDWASANQRALSAELAVLRRMLRGEAEDAREVETLREARAAMPSPCALDSLAAAFGLSEFERAIVLFCTGVELDAQFATEARPTFSRALACLPSPHWSALLPDAPLRQWRLIDFAPNQSLTTTSLRIDERILHFVAGLSYLDERLHSLAEPLTREDLPPTHDAIAQKLSTIWNASAFVPVELTGEDAAAKRAIVAAAATKLSGRAFVVQVNDIPTSADERATFMRLWEREAALGRVFLLIEGAADAEQTLSALVRRMGVRLALATPEPLRNQPRALVKLDVPPPVASEQEQLWVQVLGPDAARLNGQLEQVTAQFRFGTNAIRAIGEELRLTSDRGAALWDVCRRQARRGLEELAQRIEPVADWNDLVLPEPQKRTLYEIAAHVRQRTQVYERWGFAAKSARGLGISALFAGSSGTGKTMAAEVLAGELQLDLYRIDLASVVSKYIGETEKNLRRVFDVAEGSGAILLFDEADALFGKRSEVKDSHDRYANIEISYLLQRMESYRGLAILTSNRKEALDSAFLRRIRLVVQFPFPDATQRGEIWRRIFPAAMPRHSLDVAKLSRLNIAGGNIRNIAMKAAFLAADAGEPVRMNHLLRAARNEYEKLEQPLTDSEIGGWM